MMTRPPMSPPLVLILVRHRHLARILLVVLVLILVQHLYLARILASARILVLPVMNRRNRSQTPQ